jgi:hypothetical protein
MILILSYICACLVTSAIIVIVEQLSPPESVDVTWNFE